MNAKTGSPCLYSRTFLFNPSDKQATLTGRAGNRAVRASMRITRGLILVVVLIYTRAQGGKVGKGAGAGGRRRKEDYTVEQLHVTVCPAEEAETARARLPGKSCVTLN